MAFLPTKHLVLMTIVLLFFMITIGNTQGRNLPVELISTDQELQQSTKNENGEEMFTRNEAEQPRDGEDLAVMDYTPARKKTPIHN
ncbi:hypothetical protein ACJIZ3_004730 [Penstemon smallii]|uniref:Uncharacterized protein n=1 Tax=Penstemon smallii TaxID=265156 RepID=A0ABD3S2V9_9LAMI